MNKIRFRTKIEAILGASLLMVIAVVSIASVSRTISDTHDDVYAYIRNSNGNYWEATGANLQKAIWDLNDTGYNYKGGTVWLPGNTTITLTKPINISSPDGAISRNNLIIQGAGRSSVLQGDDTFNIIEIADLRYSTLRDFTVKDGLNGICFYDGETSIGSAEYCTFENLYVWDCANDGIHVYKGYILSFFNCYLSDNGGDGLYIDAHGGGGYNINGGSYWSNSKAGINITCDETGAVSINGVCSEHNYDGIRVYSGGMVKITGCYVEGSSRYSYVLGGHELYGYCISLEQCYANHKRVYVDAPNCKIDGCWLRANNDTMSIETTADANNLTILPGRYDKGIDDVDYIGGIKTSIINVTTNLIIPTTVLDEPVDGSMFFNDANNTLAVYYNSRWWYYQALGE